ncbi:hypothetical protein KUF71_011001 [Frankliniella fusca]|uniref:Uncharacterized protein n=1 Tax=Frankliniella fusca TaxID=407009 RepID=A0AAE1HJN1_9NEOP|nr:hypothetical protein KUF71_011001 [Frankliniella fusca]
MAGPSLSKKAKKRLKESLTSVPPDDAGSSNVITPSASVDIPSNLVVPFEGAPTTVVPPAGHISYPAAAVAPLISFNALLDARDASLAYCGNNMSVDRETAFTPSSAFDVLRHVAPPQVGGAVPFVQPSEISVDHSLHVTAMREHISSLNTGDSLDWHHFLTMSSAESDGDNGDSYQEINVNFHATQPDISTENDSESTLHEQEVSVHQELYKNSAISLHDTLVSLLSFAQSSHLTGVEFCKLLDLCHLLLPAPNILPTSKHSFFKHFANHDSELNCVFYCNVRWKRRTNGSDKCSCPKSKVQNFISCPLVEQFQRLYQRPGFREKLQYKFNRKKVNAENIEDIYDSNVYKEAERTFLMDPNNISLTWYTDGVSIYECSSYTLWVFVCVINELPPEERFKPENLVIGGLWGESEKPHPNLFLLPIYQEVPKLKQGFNVQSNSVETHVKVIVLCGTCDVPANAAFMNMKGHSGYYSCPKCFIIGEKSERTENVCVFSHQEELDLRNKENYKECVQRSIVNEAAYKGVFGPTLLSFMVHSSFIPSVSIDSMHCLYIGFTKQLLNLLFNTKYSSSKFSLCSKTVEVNARLKQLQLPHFVERLPEDVTKLSFWKASLCRNLILYIMLVVFKGVMKQEYYNNLVLLVNALSVLNSSSISLSDLETADSDLCKFCADLENLYSVRHMSSSLHLLRHLASSVHDTGNLFISSCFRFEDLNGKLADLAHGTRHATMQIASNFNVMSKLPILISNVSSDSAKLFCRKVTGRKHYLQCSEVISIGSFVVGELDTVPEHEQCLLVKCSVLFQQPFQIHTFPKVFHQGMLYVSDSYNRGSRVSSYCRYVLGNRILLGKILTFAKITTSSETTYFALILKSDDLPSGLNRYCLVNTQSDGYDLVLVNNLNNVSFYLQVDTDHFVVDPINSFEME